MFAWLRFGGDGAPPVAVVSNMTPVPREGWRIGLPFPGKWREILNSDAKDYGGSARGNAGHVVAEAIPAHGQPCSAAMTLPPLATLWLAHEPGQ